MKLSLSELVRKINTYGLFWNVLEVFSILRQYQVFTNKEFSNLRLLYQPFHHSFAEPIFDLWLRDLASSSMIAKALYKCNAHCCRMMLLNERVNIKKKKK